MQTNDPSHTTTFAAFAGSILWAMANYFAVAYAPVVTPQGKQKAVVEGIFAVISGVIGGYYAAPAICIHFKITDIQSVSFIGLLTGLVFWKAIPGLVLGIVAWVSSKTQKLDSGAKQ